MSVLLFLRYYGSKSLGTIVTSIIVVTIIIMYIYHALVNALSAHMIHINLNMIFCTRVDHSPTKTIYIKYYVEKQIHTHGLTHTHTHTHTHRL